MTLCIEQPQDITSRYADSLYDNEVKQPKSMFFYGLDLKHDRLFHVSSAVKEVLGYSPQEIMQNGLRWFVQQISTEDLESINHLADQHPNSRLTPQIHYHFKTKKGVRCELHEHRCLLYDSNGAPSYVIGRVEKV